MSNMMLKNLLEDSGFTDLVENSDHTFNGTKDGYRYENMWLSGWRPDMSDNDTVQVVDVTLEYNKGSLS
jgi:hypothetical protein